jgi:hypothetical protein
MKTSEQLAQIFREAQTAADAVQEGDDGGTCNLDSVVLQPRNSTMRLKKAFELLGWDYGNGFNWLGAKSHFSGLRFRGQGNMRARMAKAAYDYIRTALLNDSIMVWHWQQMD